MMLILQDATYIHPNKDLLFTDINLVLNKHDKIALIGNNGVGKSTLLKILAGKLHLTNGIVKSNFTPYYQPQLFGQFNEHNIAQVLQIECKLNALKEILEGQVTDDNLDILNDDWAIEERCQQAFAHWELDGLELDQKVATLSGGQKTKVFLAGILIHRPEIVLMDEPSNHLDTLGRNLLYDYIKSTKDTIVVVSHDRTLLNLLHTVYELSKRGIAVYGGNYDFYASQKIIESDALYMDIRNREKALRRAKDTKKEALERQQKLDARGKKKQEKAGLPAISMNTFRNNAERSSSRMKEVHAGKIDAISQELNRLRETLSNEDKMRIGFDNSVLHKGKILVTAIDVNFGYEDRMLWKRDLSCQITSGERIVIKGLNGSGKTTLLKIILGELLPCYGTIDTADIKTLYIDQNYSIIDNGLKVYEQAQQFNSGKMQEHDIKICLNRFLFTKDYWDKLCRSLSGGEKMRLMLCSLTINNQAPDIIVLDEPTNNLDIRNIEILTAAVNEYRGTLLVVSHDEHFLEQIYVERSIYLEKYKW